MEGQESLRQRRDDSIPPNLPEDVHTSFNPDRTSPIDPKIDEADLNRGLSMWPVTMSHGPTREAGPPAESVAYIFKKLIGEGGFGEVWESVQTSLDRVVAVKRMRSDIVENIADSRDARAYGL